MVHFSFSQLGLFEDMLVEKQRKVYTQTKKGDSESYQEYMEVSEKDSESRQDMSK